MKDERLMKGKTAFTLIELLIVVAIIAILAAIAVPNFLEAQLRSKIARVKGDMRTASMALESYRIDNNAYPHLEGFRRAGKGQWDRGGFDTVYNLTTPVAYLSSVALADPFSNAKAYNEYGIITWMPTDTSFSIHYINVRLFFQAQKKPMLPSGRPQYYLLSLGPDYLKGPDPRNGGAWGLASYTGTDPDKSCHWDAWGYDPSNGTVSKGDILRYP